MPEYKYKCYLCGRKLKYLKYVNKIAYGSICVKKVKGSQIKMEFKRK